MLPSYHKTIEIIKDSECVIAENQIDILIRLGNLHGMEKDSELELQYKRKAFYTDNSNINARYALFQTYRMQQKTEEARSLLEEASRNSINEKSTQLEPLIQKAAEDKEQSFHTLYRMTALCASESRILDILLQDIDTAIAEARTARIYQTLSPLLLHKGIATHYYSKNEQDGNSSAFNIWMECVSEIQQNIQVNEDKTFHLERVNRQLSLYHFEQAEAGEEGHIEIMEQIAQGCTGLSPATIYLAAYFHRHGQPDRARNILQPHMGLAFDLLSGDTTTNDPLAYTILLDCLICGDDFEGSQIAHSMVSAVRMDRKTLLVWLKYELEQPVDGTEEILSTLDSDRFMLSQWDGIDCLIKKAESLDTTWEQESSDSGTGSPYLRIQALLKEYKDAMLGRLWTSGYCDNCLTPCDGYYACKICFNVVFCKECRDGIQKGMIISVLCRANHDWHQLPVLDAVNFVLSCKRKVRKGAQIGPDGNFIGGK